MNDTTAPKTCRELVADRMADRANHLRLLYDLADHAADETTEEEAHEELDNFALDVEVRTSLKILLMTGGPADWLEVPIQRAHYGWEIAGTVTYHYADWFDHAETAVDEDSALYRFAENAVELMTEEPAR